MYYILKLEEIYSSSPKMWSAAHQRFRNGPSKGTTVLPYPVGREPHVHKHAGRPSMFKRNFLTVGCVPRVEVETVPPYMDAPHAECLFETRTLPTPSLEPCLPGGLWASCGPRQRAHSSWPAQRERPAVCPAPVRPP